MGVVKNARVVKLAATQDLLFCFNIPTKQKLEFFVNSKKACFEYYEDHDWGKATKNLLDNKQAISSRMKALITAAVYYDLFLREIHLMPLFDWALNQRPSRLMSIDTYEVLALRKTNPASSEDRATDF